MFVLPLSRLSCFGFSKRLKNLDKKPSKKRATKRFEWRSWGGYTPELIILKKSVPARIVFDRKDPSPCLDQIVFPDFGVHADLPMGEEYIVEITPEQSGEFGFACGMNMMHGKMIVE